MKKGKWILLIVLLLTACAKGEKYADPFNQWKDYSALLDQEMDSVLNKLEEEGIETVLVTDDYAVIYRSKEPEILEEEYEFPVEFNFHEKTLVGYQKRWSGAASENQDFIVDFWNQCLEWYGKPTMSELHACKDWNELSGIMTAVGEKASDDYFEMLYAIWPEKHMTLRFEYREKQDTIQIEYICYNEQTWEMAVGQFVE